jgi:hypothetical protein
MTPSPETSNPRRCVAVGPEPPDAGGMKEPATNRSRKIKLRPASLGGWVLAWLLWADTAVRYLTDLTIHLTELVRAVQELLWLVGYIG